MQPSYPEDVALAVLAPLEVEVSEREEDALVDLGRDVAAAFHRLRVALGVAGTHEVRVASRLLLRFLADVHDIAFCFE